MNILEKSIGTDNFAAMAKDPVVFVRAFDREPWAFQAEDMRLVAERDDQGIFKKRIAILSEPRQNGKSTLSGWLALWRFFTDKDHQEITSVCLDRDSARIILDDARRIISKSDILHGLIDGAWGLTKNEIRLRDGRTWKIKSADAVYSRGQGPSLVCYDELGWSSDDGELYNVLSAAQAAQPNPLTIITSTVSPIQAGPLWELFQAAEAGDPDIRLIYRTDNPSPLITQKYLDGQQAKLPAHVFAREHNNLWGSGSGAFCTEGDWTRATDDGDPTRDRDPGPSFLFCDLGWIHDETAIAVAKRQGEKVDILTIAAFKPAPGMPIEFKSVEEKIKDLAGDLNVKRVEIESPQGVGMAQKLSLDGLRAQVLHPTSKSNMERWGALNVALKNGSVRLPQDAKLRRQLLTLTIKESTTGWRVIDVPSIHNDRAVAVAGALYMAKNVPGKMKVLRLVDGNASSGRIRYKQPTMGAIIVRCECGKAELVSRTGHPKEKFCPCGRTIDVDELVRKEVAK